MDYITTGVLKRLSKLVFSLQLKPLPFQRLRMILNQSRKKPLKKIESAPVVEDKKPEITEPDTHDTKDKSLKSFLGRIKKAVVPEIDEDAF